MTWDAWIIFVLFWIVFVTTPGPNAVNCINNGMTLGFRRALVGVLAILTQATLFLLLSALGVTALIAASPVLFSAAKLLGAAVLIILGLRTILNANKPVTMEVQPAGWVFFRAFAIATINPKSVAGYLAAFSQFVQPNVPIWTQMGAIVPTALSLTAISYTGFTALGASVGRAALGAVFNIWVRRIMGACFVIYGVALGAAQTPGLV